jgi:hypothetical protein
MEEVGQNPSSSADIRKRLRELVKEEENFHLELKQCDAKRRVLTDEYYSALRKEYPFIYRIRNEDPSGGWETGHFPTCQSARLASLKLAPDEDEHCIIVQYHASQISDRDLRELEEHI